MLLGVRAMLQSEETPEQCGYVRILKIKAIKTAALQQSFIQPCTWMPETAASGSHCAV